MQRGRKPTPTVLKLLRGNPGRRPINADEPQCAPATLEPPEALEGVARSKWEKMAPQLLEVGLLAQIDSDALEGYCVSYASWVDALEKLKTLGKVIASPNGYPIPSPYLAIARNAHAEMRGFQADFGMTPSARARVNAKGGGAAKRNRLQRFIEKQAQARQIG